MRRMLMLVALGAILAVPLVGSAGATEAEVPPVEVVCKDIRVPVTVNAGVAIEKKITLGGTILNANVNQRVIKVVKTVAVQVCVKTHGDVVANVDLEAALNGEAACPHGAVGVTIAPHALLDGGAKGGAVEVAVRVAVADKDEILGTAFDEMEVVIGEHKRVDVPAARVEDDDLADVAVCVGPVEGL